MDQAEKIILYIRQNGGKIQLKQDETGFKVFDFDFTGTIRQSLMQLKPQIIVQLRQEKIALAQIEAVVLAETIDVYDVLKALWRLGVKIWLSDDGKVQTKSGMCHLRDGVEAIVPLTYRDMALIRLFEPQIKAYLMSKKDL